MCPHQIVLAGQVASPSMEKIKFQKLSYKKKKNLLHSEWTRQLTRTPETQYFPVFSTHVVETM